MKNEDNETIGTFNLSFAQAAVLMPSITSITSNGDPLVNGGETPIVPGTNYALTLSGRNLNLLAIGNFSVPQGSTLTITSQTATQINMQLKNAQLGVLSCSYEGTTLFSGTLTQAFDGTTTSGTIMIKVNNATIATINVTAPSTGGGGGPDMG